MKEKKERKKKDYMSLHAGYGHEAPYSGHSNSDIKREPKEVLSLHLLL